MRVARGEQIDAGWSIALHKSAPSNNARQPLLSTLIKATSRPWGSAMARTTRVWRDEQIDMARSATMDNATSLYNLLRSLRRCPSWKGRSIMTLFLFCLVLVLVVALVGIYVRLSPLRAFSDQRTAHQGAQEGREKVRVTEGEELRKGLRGLIKELTDTLHLERRIANDRWDQLDAGRAAWQALLAQVQTERRASETLCAELYAGRLASEALRQDLELERLALLDAFFSETAPERVEKAAQDIARSRALRAAHAKWKELLSAVPKAVGRDEETKREGHPTILSAPERRGAAYAEPARVQKEKPAALAGEGPMEGERLTALPTTPEEFAEQSKLVAATAASEADADADSNATTTVFLTNDLAAALSASREEGTDEEEPTRVVSKDDVAAALGAGAGGATLNSQTAPRVVRPVVVAPPASAPPPLPAAPAIKAAGLGRPRRAPVEPPAPLQRNATLQGLQAIRPPAPADGPPEERTSWPNLKQGGMGHTTHPAAGSAPHAPVPHASKTLPSMPALGAAPTSSPSDSTAPSAHPDDRTTFDSLPFFLAEPSNHGGEATGEPVPEPPLYTVRRPASEEGLRDHAAVPEAISEPSIEPSAQTTRRARGVEQKAGE
jgi:hypothetical protein